MPARTRNQGQILKNGKGTDEVEDLRVREGGEGQVEGPKNGRKSVQWNEGYPLIAPQVGVYVQAYNTAEGGERIYVRSGDELGMTDG